MRVLAVSCHPDDVEICAGGTMLRYAKRGDEVALCHVANGDKGDYAIPMAELGVIRNREAEEGGRALGAREVISLNVGDLMVNSGDPEQVLALVEVIRRVNPDVIFTHHPGDYMKDHIEVSKLVFDASFSATIPHFGRGKSTLFAAPIFYMDTSAGIGFQPEHYVNITGEIEQKLAALRCHKSQMTWLREHDNVDYADKARTCARYRGYQCGVDYAEGFISCKRHLRLTTKQLLPMD